MRKFKIQYPDETGEDVVEIITEHDILYGGWYEEWEAKMIRKFGEGHEWITKENCIDDYVIIHWAEEIFE